MSMSCTLSVTFDHSTSATFSYFNFRVALEYICVGLKGHPVPVAHAAVVRSTSQGCISQLWDSGGGPLFGWFLLEVDVYMFPASRCNRMIRTGNIMVGIHWAHRLCSVLCVDFSI